MGFTVVYLPPVHPIGVTHRKGPNNITESAPGDPGSPWAIGSAAGGHTSVHPDLGTLADFDSFVAAAQASHLEVAIDYALQCSPDHPWVTEHPQWFRHRSDGSIRYAENPPKRYQDIYPIDFDTDDSVRLWEALAGVVRFWIDHGVRIFRVDNPHTKPFAFWEWLIAEIHREHPSVLFLAEAFTRPAVMQRLGKIGFSQSYTYFTWRNSAWELGQYLTELSQTELIDWFRPNFWVNTPDILHATLQHGGAPAFRMRAVLAAITCPSWGMYSGYELFEATPLRDGSEEYLDSEKYQLRPRDWTSPWSLAPYITRLNQIRDAHRDAIAQLSTLRIHHMTNEAMLCVSRATPDKEDVLLLVVSLDPHHPREATTWLDLGALGIAADHPFEVHDELGGGTFTWQGPVNYVRLDPSQQTAHVFHVRMPS
jgi:starch synthase (maltosyl-transferring)